MILDLFAGPGGWSEGLATLGLADIGIEWDAAACATRAAAGHLTIRADVAQYPTDPFVGKVTGLIASPPCQDFSMAGKRAGIVGDRGQLLTEVMRWARALRPEWIACEQVPPVLPWWETYAHDLRELGYSTWSGVLCAADYGVPQTRRRAILMASRVRAATPPAPTHDECPADGLFGRLEPWVAWGEALACSDGVLDRREQSGGVPVRLVPSTEPAPTVTGNAGARGKWLLRASAMSRAAVRRDDQLAPTITSSMDNGDANLIAPSVAARPITVTEAATLQNFPPRYPWRGTKAKQFEQIGNAVPPTLAAAVVAALTGRTA